jgi:hypothetical protein
LYFPYSSFSTRNFLFTTITAVMSDAVILPEAVPPTDDKPKKAPTPVLDPVALEKQERLDRYFDFLTSLTNHL